MNELDFLCRSHQRFDNIHQFRIKPPPMSKEPYKTVVVGGRQNHGDRQKNHHGEGEFDVGQSELYRHELCRIDDRMQLSDGIDEFQNQYCRETN